MKLVLSIGKRNEVFILYILEGRKSTVVSIQEGLVAQPSVLAIIAALKRPFRNNCFLSLFVTKAIRINYSYLYLTL